MTLHNDILANISKATSQHPVNAANVLTALGCSRAAFDTALATLKHQGRINSCEVTRPAQGSFPMLMIWPTGMTNRYPWSHGNENVHLSDCRDRACRVCGCTWNKACPGGCYWVEPDLCSACVPERNTKQEKTDMPVKPKRARGELRQEITALLKDRPMTLKAIADSLKSMQQTILPVLKRMQTEGLVVRGADCLWSLVDVSPWSLVDASPVSDAEPESEGPPACAEDAHDDDIDEAPEEICSDPKVPIRVESLQTIYTILHSVLPAPSTERAVRELVASCHAASWSAGWWNDRETGESLIGSYAGKYLPRVPVAEKLLLIHSEISEAMEGYRTGAASRKIIDFWELEEELADVLIRVCDFAGGLNLDLAGAVAAKLAYNRKRPDHRPENRAQPGGKQF